MFKHTRILISALTSVSMLVLTAYANDEAVKKQIQAKYDQYEQAFRKKDVNIMIALATSDFTYKSKQGGVQNLAQVKQEMQAGLKMIKKLEQMSAKIDTIKVNGNTAIVNSTISATAKVEMPDPKTNKPKLQTFKNVSNNKDTWVKTANGWKIKRSVEIKSAMWIDGKKAM